MPRPKLTSEIALFITSFFIAMIIWIVAKQNDFENQTVSAHVTVVEVPENIETQITPPNVNISVQYPKTYAHLIIPDAFTIELKGIDENFAGIDSFKLTPMNISLRNVVMHNLPDSVRPTALAQDFVNINARILTEKARIVVQKTGNPAQGYRLIVDPPPVQPAEILLTGPPKNLAKAKKQGEEFISLQTAAVNIEGKNDNYFETVDVPLPEGFKYIQEDRMRIQVLDKLSVQVHVVIGEKEMKKTFPDVPIVIKTFSKNLKAQYSPLTASVTVEASKSMLQGLSADSFIFIPRQPLEETPDYTADIAIDARFSDNIPRAVREKVGIVSWQPEVIRIKIIPVSEGTMGKTDGTSRPKSP